MHTKLQLGQNGHGWRPLWRYIQQVWTEWHMVHTNICTIHHSAHMQIRQGVSFTRALSSEGSIALLQADSPPLCILLRVPKWGGGNRAGHVIYSWGSRIWNKEKKPFNSSFRFTTAILESFKFMRMIYNPILLGNVKHCGHQRSPGMKSCYIELVKINDLTFCLRSLSNHSIILASSLGL